jgi:hypothetical protein
MNDEAVKAAVARFLIYVNGTAQLELEKAVRRGLASGTLRANEPCTTGVTLSIEKVGLDVTIYGTIKL